MDTKVLAAVTLGVITFVCSFRSSAADEVLRAVLPGDLGLPSQQAFRKASTDRFLKAVADFDGNGKSDTASLKVDLAKNEAVVIVVLSRRAGAALELRRFKLSDLPNVGIAVVKRGTFFPACSRRAGPDCNAAAVTVSRPSINLFNYEGAATYYYWDRTAFRALPIAD